MFDRVHCLSATDASTAVNYVYTRGSFDCVRFANFAQDDIGGWGVRFREIGMVLLGTSI
jgi:hypothetical protein